MTTICLSMIVKNESENIVRCLESVKGLIDSFVIVDTGSTDNTKDLIIESIGDKSGVILDEPWIDFSTNRNQSLTKARELADYVLIIDADEELVGYIDKEQLTCDAYYTKDGIATLSYKRLLLLKSTKPWVWHGPVHEYLDCGECTEGFLMGVSKLHHSTQDNTKRNIAILQKHLEKEPNNPRSLFYLGQSLFDLGEWEAACDAYTLRTKVKGWIEETWYAIYKMGQCLDNLGKNPIIMYLNAYKIRPHRLEPLHGIVYFCRRTDEFELGYLFGLRALEIEYPKDDLLFIHNDIYSYQFFDEFALCCHYTGRKELAVKYGTLAYQNNPQDQRLKENLDWYNRA